MSNSQIAKDLGHDLQQRVGEVLTRQLTIAQAVLPPAQCVLLFLEAAVAVSISAAASYAAAAGDPARRGELFDLALCKIAELAAGERERSLGKVHERFGGSA